MDALPLYTKRRVETEAAVSDELIEVTENEILSREAAAARLRQLADQLARHNQIEFVREGTRYSGGGTGRGEAEG